MGFDAACLEHFFEASGVFFDIGCVAGDVGNGEEFAQLPHDAVCVGQAIGVDFFDDVFCGRQNSLGFDLAADSELRRGERAIEEQGEAHGLDSEIQWIHLLSPRFIKSWKRHAGNFAYATKRRTSKSACATVYFQHPVTMEYFREHTGFGQDESTDIQFAAGPAFSDGKRTNGTNSGPVSEKFYGHSGGRRDFELQSGTVWAFLFHAERREVA